MYASLFTKKISTRFAHLQRPYDVRRMPVHFPPGGGFIAVIITDFLRNVNKRPTNPNRIDRPARTPPPRVFPGAAGVSGAYAAGSRGQARAPSAAVRAATVIARAQKIAHVPRQAGNMGRKPRRGQPGGGQGRTLPPLGNGRGTGSPTDLRRRRGPLFSFQTPTGTAPPGGRKALRRGPFASRKAQ